MKFGEYLLLSIVVVIIGLILYGIGYSKGFNAALASESEWTTVEMEITAYCPCTKCCGKWGKIPVSKGTRKTASGFTLFKGAKIVAAPPEYAFGTEMIIEGYNDGKIVKVEDRGGAIKGNCLDLYFDDHQTALEWGRKKNYPVKIKISK